MFVNLHNKIRKIKFWNFFESNKIFLKQIENYCSLYYLYFRIFWYVGLCFWDSGKIVVKKLIMIAIAAIQLMCKNSSSGSYLAGIDFRGNSDFSKHNICAGTTVWEPLSCYGIVLMFTYYFFM